MDPEQVETLVKQVTAPPPGLVAKPALHRVPASAWRYALRRALHNFLVDLHVDTAGALTYYAVLSVFPALLALLTLLSLLGEQRATARWLTEFATRYLNADLAELLRDPITRLTQVQHAGWVLALSLLIALWGANGYVSAFGRAMNRVLDVAEGRPLWKVIPYNLMLTAGTLLIGGVTLLTMVLSNKLILTMNGVPTRGASPGASASPLPSPTMLPTASPTGFGGGGPARTLLEQWDAVRWPVLLLTAVVYTSALFHLTPNVKQGRFRWITPGSVTAIAGMVLAVLGFNLWVDKFSTFNETYGAVGSFIVLLLGLWIINCALLFGGVLDAELERVRELLAGIEAERTLQLPPRDISLIKTVVANEEKLVAEARRLRENRPR